MTLQDLWRLIKHNVLVLVAATFIGVLLAAGYSLTQPRLYAATSTGYVVATPAAASGAAPGTDPAVQKANTYIPIVQSRGVAERIAKELQLSESSSSIGASLSAWVVPDSLLLKITAVSTSPERARAVADAAIRATSAEAARLDTMALDGTSSGNSEIGLVLIEAAVTPSTPVSPDWRRNLLAGLGGGLLVGLAIGFVRRALDNRVRHSDEVESLTGAGVLGVIPITSSLAGKAGDGDLGIASEALRQLRTNLRFVNVDQPPRSIVVTSANPGEGKSTVSSALARLLAESGQPTILVDADLRRPAQAKLFERDGLVGLTQVLAGDLPAASALEESGTDGLQLLLAGRIPPNPSELVGSQRMHRLIEELSQEHTVIIDAPPLLPVTDAGLLTAASDGAILVLKVGKTYKEQVALAVRMLGRVGGKMLGSVMNMAPERGLGSVIYGYGYGNYKQSYYYYAEDGSKRARRSASGGYVSRSKAAGKRGK
nr:polysaccharide biosynthesis tyrosine autokinase [Propionibacterium sp.]